MEKKFGDWYKIARLACTDDSLKRRWQGIEGFAETVSPEDILDLGRLFYQRSPKDSSFKDRLGEVFQKVDATFGVKDNDAELAVLCGTCLMHLASSVVEDDPTAFLAAMTIICPAFQGKGASGIVPDIETEARNCLAKHSADLRSVYLAERKEFKLPPTAQLSEAITAASNAEADPWSDGGKKLVAWSEAVHKTISDICSTVQAVQKDMVLRREESDILWWMTAGFSRDLDRPISEMELGAACILVGKEFGDLVRVLPGPHAARAVIHKMLQKGTNQTEDHVNLGKAVTATSRDWRTSWVRRNPDAMAFDLCPVHFAAERSLEADDEYSWAPSLKGVTQVDADIDVPPADLAFQVYQETLLMKALSETEGEK